MGMMTIHLEDDDERFLDESAGEFGGRENTVLHTLRLLAAEQRRKEALNSFLEDWSIEAGPPDAEAVAAMAERYGL